MKKKILGIVICFFLTLVATLNFGFYEEIEAATVKLNKTKKTLRVGQTFKLKLKNADGTVTFSSANEKVVTVATNGLVTAVAKGKTIVKAKHNNITYKCKFTVRKAQKTNTDEDVYNKIIALKADYPEGMKWTNNNSYVWGKEAASGLGYSGYTGYGCMGFAMLASDAAFGNVPAYKYTDKSKIRVGDILRINNDSHSVIALKIDGNKITIAEGNFNSSIHWGRVIDIDNCNFEYGLTRYPM